MTPRGWPRITESPTNGLRFDIAARELQPTDRVTRRTISLQPLGFTVWDLSQRTTVSVASKATPPTVDVGEPMTAEAPDQRFPIGYAAVLAAGLAVLATLVALYGTKAPFRYQAGYGTEPSSRR